MTITLPLPPSANRLWRMTPRGMIKAPEYRAWADAAMWSVAAQWQQPALEYFGVTIKLPPTRRDPDNSIKPAVDALQAGGAIVDDKRLQWLTLIVDHDRDPTLGLLIDLVPALPPPPKSKAKRTRNGNRP